MDGLVGFDVVRGVDAEVAASVVHCLAALEGHRRQTEGGSKSSVDEKGKGVTRIRRRGRSARLGHRDPARNTARAM